VKKPLALVVLFAAGFVLAGGLGAADAISQTTTETTVETMTTTIEETTTAPTTVVATTTVRRPATLPTTTSSSSSDSAPTWAWVALGVLAAAVIGLSVALLTRRGGPGVPPGERRRRLDSAVATWTAQGWALESETNDSAVLQRGPERMVVTVDEAGRVSARPLGGQ
jgi:uncharacterized membrane protein YdcZ (DUF606 family)